MTGYMIAKAVTEGTEYINKALSCLELAKDETNEILGAEVFQNVDLGAERAKLYEALAALQQCEVAHKSLAKKLVKAGFRPLTSDDFTELGVTRR